MKSDSQDKLAQEIEHSLHERHGPMLGGAALYRALGYPTAAAMRQAVARGRVPVPLFDIEKRRGRFALTRDVAAWMARCRANGLTSPAANQHRAASASEENGM
ncbi:hypothetical protein [Roseateles puraquae]|uniref:Uncharacterized protein n=1 Tax=Roseateles puraquae TaxID=431059 RepID=A0A254NCJ1_9BURK|nr:hypothetical protein [Roseateles puraquae]MDG0854802.1 hypothetical protein [Roseateles puraquae]OWR04612.1 hypothetical protein CDO81_08500 [Roseateles puraquae]